jgi:hypothetical protein
VELWEAKGATVLAERARRGAARVSQVERSPDDRAKPALAIRRRVSPNAATASADRFEAAIAARDIDAIAAHLADRGELVDHTTGAVYDREASLHTWRSLLRARDGTYRHEPLATLGASLALCRVSTSASGFAGRRFDVGAYEQEYLIVIEVDANGRRRRMEVFAADHLGDAAVRLYERHAELLADGPGRVRAAATARSVAAFLGPLDLDRFALALAPDFEHHDHRGIVGIGPLRGVPEFRNWFRTLFEATDDIANRVDDVLDVRSDAAILRLTNFGTDRASGGTYERPFLSVWLFGADGLAAHLETFHVGDEAAALARFDELTGERAAMSSPKAPSRPAATRERRVRPNAATANAARFDAVIAARDMDALPALFAEVAEFV